MILPQETSAKPMTWSAESLVCGLSKMTNVSPWKMEPSMGTTSPDYNSVATIDADCCATWCALPYEPAYCFDPALDPWSNPCMPDLYASSIPNTCSLFRDSIHTPLDQSRPCSGGTVDEDANLACTVLSSGTGHHVNHHGSNINEQELPGNNESNLLVYHPRHPYEDVNESWRFSPNEQDTYANGLQTPQTRPSLSECRLQSQASRQFSVGNPVSDQYSLPFNPSDLDLPFNSNNYPSPARSTLPLTYPPLPFLPPDNGLETSLARTVFRHEDPVLPILSSENLACTISSWARESQLLPHCITIPDSSDDFTSNDENSDQLVSEGIVKSSRARRGVSRDPAQDELLCQLRDQGVSYKEIKKRLKFEGAESTLRGRYRSLTKSKAQRPRKPQWSKTDITKLKEAVSHFMHMRHRTNTNLSSRSQQQSKQKDPLFGIPWKQVAEHMARHGCHRYGNFTVKNKYCEVMGLRVSKDT